jgi:hypothetical protein
MSDLGDSIGLAVKIGAALIFARRRRRGRADLGRGAFPDLTKGDAPNRISARRRVRGEGRRWSAQAGPPSGTLKPW